LQIRTSPLLAGKYQAAGTQVSFQRVGYTGGDVPNASYRNHGTHAEANPGANTSVATILVQPDGKIVVIGNAIENATGNADLVLARYLGQ
jgi:hypothetical protein